MAKQEKKEEIKPIKRTYCTDVRKKIESGKRWRLQLDVDSDNAKNIISEVENSIAGGEYNKVINNIIRLHYSKPKKVKA